MKEVCWLKNKHQNICLKCRWSRQDENVIYTIGFDYKVIMWNIKDVANKSQSRNILEQMKQVLGPQAEKTFQYNPPFAYSLLPILLKE